MYLTGLIQLRVTHFKNRIINIFDEPLGDIAHIRRRRGRRTRYSRWRCHFDRWDSSRLRFHFDQWDRSGFRCHFDRWDSRFHWHKRDTSVLRPTCSYGPLDYHRGLWQRRRKQSQITGLCSCFASNRLRV